MKKQKNISFKDKLADRANFKWILVGTAGTGILVLIAVLVALYAWPTEIPLPESADLETAAKFMESEDFLKLSTKQRNEYMDKIAKRYAELPADESIETIEKFTRNRRKNHKVNDAFMLSYGLNHAQKCNDMPQQQREEYVSNMITVAERLGFEKDLREAYEYNFSPYATKKSKLRSMKDYHKSLPFLMQNTTAKERAEILKATKLIVDEMDSRYGYRRRKK